MAALCQATVRPSPSVGQRKKTGGTLDFNGQPDKGTLNITDNTGGSLTGTAAPLDGSLVSFSGIANIICFTAGTRTATAAGLRAIEPPQPGNQVVTRENGQQQVRWISCSIVPAQVHPDPIRIPAGLFGAERGLLVSPQRRVLLNRVRRRMAVLCARGAGGRPASGQRQQYPP